MDHVENLFVPDPPAGDNSYRIPNTRFVQNTASAAATGSLTIAGLSVLANASTVSQAASAVTDSGGNQLLVSNAANTTILWSSVSSFIDNSIGSAQGAILYRNAASWVTLAPGTQSTFLQTQGANANPQWAAAGGLVLLNTLLPNNVATIGDTTSITGSYTDYMIHFDNVVPATNNTPLLMQFATSGTTFIATSYVSVVSTNTGAGGPVRDTTIVAVLLSGSSVTATVGNSLNYGVSGFVKLFNPGSTLRRKMVNGLTTYNNSGVANLTAVCGATINGYYDGANSAVTGMQFSFNAGNIATGSIRIFGIT